MEPSAPVNPTKSSLHKALHKHFLASTSSVHRATTALLTSGNWKDAYSLAAIYAKEPLKIHRCDKPTGEVAKAAWMFPQIGQIDASAPPAKRLEQLAGLMTHKQNGRFARTIVNRLCGLS